jgi:hypothetical protein
MRDVAPSLPPEPSTNPTGSAVRVSPRPPVSVRTPSRPHRPLCSPSPALRRPLPGSFRREGEETWAAPDGHGHPLPNR